MAFGRALPPVLSPSAWDLGEVQAKRLKEVMGIVAHQVGEPCSVLWHAASQAFFSIPLRQLQQLARSLGVNVPPPGDLFTTVSTLVAHCVPGLGEEELAAILAKRGKQGSALSPDALPQELLESVGSKDDQAAVKDSNSKSVF